MRQPGITNNYTIGQPNGIYRRPDILKNLLRKKVRPFNDASEYRSDKAWEMHCRTCYEASPNEFAQYKKYSNCGYTDEEYNYHTFSKSSKGSSNSGSSQKSQKNYNRYEEYSRQAHGSYQQQNSGTYNSGNSSQGSRTSNSTTSSSGRITKEQFVNYMMDKVSHTKSKEFLDTRVMKDSEIRNLAKLFGVLETKMRNFDKATKRELTLKYHPDRTGGDDLSVKMFQIVNKLKTID